ncbi:hypothetical protein GJ629_03545 [Halapricum sp. CBA1109]|nr:hypothetical protein [Halapricum sp. CBA1109]
MDDFLDGCALVSSGFEILDETFDSLAPRLWILLIAAAVKYINETDGKSLSCAENAICVVRPALDYEISDLVWLSPRWRTEQIR